jgi:hypothetical protein
MSRCERWWSLHSRLAQLLPGIRPWHWPIIQNPRAQCPYPEGSYAAAQWRPNEAAQALARARGCAQGTEADRKVPRGSHPGLHESRSIAKALSFSAINQSLAYAKLFAGISAGSAAPTLTSQEPTQIILVEVPGVDSLP